MARFATTFSLVVNSITPPSVRRATLSDAPALAALDRFINARPWSEHQYLDACTPGQGVEQVLLIARQKEICGFVVFARIADEVSINNLIVRPQSRGQGFGAMLVSSALGLARDQGAQRGFLEVRASNDSALGLYSRLGFQEEGRRSNYYPCAVGREDAILMTVNLRVNT